MAKIALPALAFAGAALLPQLPANANVTKSLAAFNATTIGEAVFGETGPVMKTRGGPAAGVYGFYGFTGSRGAGVFGRSMNGPGVMAETLGGSSPALYALNSSAGTGAGPALLAIGQSGEAIHAVSNGNSGIVGITRSTTDASAAGVSGISETAGEKAAGSLGTKYAAVVGTASTLGIGIFGLSTQGRAVVGYDTAVRETGIFTSQAGVYGISMAGPGLVAYSIGGHRADGYSSDRHAAVGGLSFEGSGLSVFSSESAGAKIGNDSAYDTLDLSDDYAGSNDAIQVFSRAHDIDALLLDNSGNLTIEGTLVAKNGARSQTRNRNSDRLTYAAQSTQATVEDVGSAQLVAGRAAVALAPDFRETIDGTSTYAIFLTPYGDGRGLYVAQRSAAGFVVRESQGGRSTMPFDYRVVARQYGATERLPHATVPASGAIPQPHEADSANAETFGPHTEVVRPIAPPAPATR